MKIQKNESGRSIVKLLIVITVLAVGGMAGWYVTTPHRNQASSSETHRSKTAQSSNILMTVSHVGGLCADGHTCARTYNLYANGSFDGHTKVSNVEMNRLRDAINTADFSSYPVNPKPNCPSSADGPDEVLAFPQKYPNKSYKLCELQIPQNDPATVFIEDLIQAHSKN